MSYSLQTVDYEKLTERADALKKILTDKKKSVSKAPPGRVRVQTLGGHLYYYYYNEPENPQKLSQYIRAGDPDSRSLLRDVVQKTYDEKCIRQAQSELVLLDKLLKYYSKGSVEDIYDTLPKSKQDLVTPVWLSDDAFTERWLDQYASDNSIAPEYQSYATDGGERVRSKSEVFIANALNKYDVPYAYVFPVELCNHRTGRFYTAHPDFTVLNKRTRQTWLWEHLGMMGNEEYAAANKYKLIDYNKAGYYQDENMILTIETASAPFTPDEAEMVIEHYLT